MSNIRNSPVALSILGVKGHNALTLPIIALYLCYYQATANLYSMVVLIIWDLPERGTEGGTSCFYFEYAIVHGLSLCQVYLLTG